MEDKLEGDLNSYESNTKINNNLDNSIGKKKINKKIIILSVIVVLILVIVILVLINSKNKLKGDDLIAYNLIAEASYDFVDPASVRIVSGKIVFNSNKESYDGYFVISAKDSSGARVSNAYILTYYNGKVIALTDKYVGAILTYAYKHSDLNYDLINKKLQEKWKSFS